MVRGIVDVVVISAPFAGHFPIIVFGMHFCEDYFAPAGMTSGSGRKYKYKVKSS